VPTEGSTTFDDVIHGSITWENARLDDFVILKSDGYPTYHLAHLVDDHLMEISHVLRGDEWISSTPRHLLLYEALGWEPPAFAHLPAILGSDGKKLSKRHGPTGIAAFEEGGYLPEAMVNYLALCGWSPGTDEEVFSLPELVRRFALERVSKSGAIFDHDKLEWFNGLHIRAQSPADLAERMRPFLPGKNRDIAAERLEPIARLLQDRLKTLAEVPELTDFFFQDPLDYDLALLVRPGMDNQATARALAAAANLARQVSPFVHEALEAGYRELCLELGLKTTQLFMAVRVAVTGKTATPPLFETMTVLGRDVVISRLEAAAAKLAPN
jgi:glutamyl-tRNA synthetase